LGLDILAVVQVSAAGMDLPELQRDGEQWPPTYHGTGTEEIFG
jgi:hypothetical protein